MGLSSFGDGTGYGIGIDLGTASICTAIFRDDEAEIIPHEGHLLMPSCVAFTETGRLVGAAGKNQAGTNSANTVFGALRFIERSFDDPQIQKMIKELLFWVVSDRSGSPAVKRDAQSYLGQRPISAVITIPATFSISQRQAVHDAAMIADFKPLRLLSASVSACLNYATTQRPDRETNKLIAYFGARSMDVAVAIITQGMVEIKVIAGANYLRGDYLDTRLVRYAANVFKQKIASDLTTNFRALHRLRTACEKAKQELSSQTQTTINIDQLCDGHDFVWTVTRESLEYHCSDLLEQCLLPIEQALRGAKIEKAKIHAAIVGGGSSRVHWLQQLISDLSDLFNFMLLSRCLNPDEAATRGAAFNAAILSGDGSSKVTDENMLIDVAPFTIGIGTQKNGGFLFSVFGGERARTKDDGYLGKSVLPLSQLLDGPHVIEITLNWDSNGSIQAHAKDESSGISTQLSCVDPDRLSTEELVLMKAKVMDFDISDETEERRIEAKNAAEEYIFGLLDYLCSEPQTYDTRRKTNLANEFLEWLDEKNDVAVLEYTTRLHRLQEAAENTLEKLQKYPKP
ncbi:heat shock protein 70 [Clathrospora elynae]|uniref:Heat shock protein 70 n=1 Tax=Clathrospora elynae TaxID=706981 RepID=A0A6A5S9U3_9PLEO|nr:heat shock protein 70 [Clathrospora elynae]